MRSRTIRPGIVLLALCAAIAAPSRSAAEEFATELTAVKFALLPILAPLHADYAAEIRKSEVKDLVEQSRKGVPPEEEEEAKAAPKPGYRCYLSPRDITLLLIRDAKQKAEEAVGKMRKSKYLLPDRIVEKDFKFKRDCHVNGIVHVKRGIFRVDLSLKEIAPYYRIRFFVDLDSVVEKNTGLVRVKARIYDGELFAAERPHEADFEFLGDYTMVINENGGAAARGEGSIYVKKFQRAKADKLMPLVFAN